MTLLVPTVGENKLLAFALGVETPGNQTLKLFVNNYTPVDGSVAGDFSEMSTHGYAAKTLTKTSWVITQVSSKASGTYAQQTWTFTAATLVTVYGYYVVDSTTGVVLWGELLGTPTDVEDTGDIIRVTPVFTLAKP